MTLTDYRGRVYDAEQGDGSSVFTATCSRCQKAFSLTSPPADEDVRRHFARELQRVAGKHPCRRKVSLCPTRG